MKQLKIVLKIIAVALVLSLAAPSLLPLNSVSIAEAATVKLNKKSLTLEVGKTYTLKVTGTKSKVTWSSNKKSVATVSTKGKVKAIKAGKAVITATVNKKKYTCNVTVKKASSSTVDYKAPFDTQDFTLLNIKSSIPKDWSTQTFEAYGYAMIYPTSDDLYLSVSSISLFVQETGEKAPSYAEIKESFTKEYTEEDLLAQLNMYGDDVKLTDLKYSDYESKLGTAFKISYNFAYSFLDEKMTMHQDMYILCIDNYTILVIATDGGDKVSPSISQAAECVINTIQLVK